MDFSLCSSSPSTAGSIFTDATSLGGGVATYVTCECSPQSPFVAFLPTVSFTAVGGKAETVITSAGGEAITLASSGFGVATSFAGSVYTAATDAASTATGTGNAAIGMHTLSISTPLLTSLLVALSTVVVGAWVAL